MKKIARNILSKYVLLLLFMGYYVNISFFTHSHVLNGRTVVHSHIYKGKAANGQANHSHSTTQIQLISTLSLFLATGETPQSFVFCKFPEYIETKAVIPNTLLRVLYLLGKLHLRAPPSYC